MTQSRARQVAAVLGATLFFGGLRSAGEETRLAPVVVSGPTVIAFFMAGRSKELNSAARADFERYAARAAPALREAGIDFHELYPKRSIEIQTQGHTRILKPPFGAGYYFLTADGESKIEYGIKTDTELLHHARQYLPREPARPRE